MEDLLNQIANFIERGKSHLNSPFSLEIKGGFNLIHSNVRVKNKSKLIINNIEFITENIITTQPQNIKGSALFTCTLGKQYDVWGRSFNDQNDIFYRYFADAIGSEIVEAAVDWLEGQINIKAEILELKSTNRYSPGNCEWNVSDQHKLFSFFPDNFCEIEITDSARMTTIKFMSGIIGLSENVKKKTDTCNICSMVNFYIRLQEYE